MLEWFRRRTNRDDVFEVGSLEYSLQQLEGMIEDGELVESANFTQEEKAKSIIRARQSQHLLPKQKRYFIYLGKEHDLYLSLPDFEKLQRNFKIQFDRDGKEPPVIYCGKARYEVISPMLLTEDKGYYCIHGKYEGSKGIYKIPLHRLAYVAFYGTPPPGYHIHHIDRDKHNNSADNLVALTEEEHCIVHNRDVRTPRNMFTKPKPRGLLSRVQSAPVEPKSDAFTILLEEFSEQNLKMLLDLVVSERVDGRPTTVLEKLVERYLALARVSLDKQVYTQSKPEDD